MLTDSEKRRGGISEPRAPMIVLGETIGIHYTVLRTEDIIYLVI